MKRISRLARARPAQAFAGGATADERVISIEFIGARGDGHAEGVTGPLYAPFTLPGESVRARIAGDRAETLEILTQSAERQAPVCAHFGRCGGCQLQHWQEAPYLAWKREQVVRAMERRGLDPTIHALIPAWGEGRRRAAFHATRTNGRLELGFIERGGARNMAIENCPALAPKLEQTLPILRAIAAILAPPKGEIILHCLLTDTGVDCDVKSARAPSPQQLEALARAASGLARLSLDGDPFVVNATPSLRFGDVAITPPPGAFLQPTQAGEEALAREVDAAVRGATKIVDLFCGIGTFALRLARNAEVTAMDSEEVMLTALRAAADRAALPRVVATRRDLLRTPLSALEMKKAQAVVFDPPRSGARQQAGEIAKSAATKVAAVSCDPATFARDARVLVDGGFTLERVAVIDQFRWTPHVEVVGAFTR